MFRISRTSLHTPAKRPSSLPKDGLCTFAKSWPSTSPSAWFSNTRQRVASTAESSKKLYKRTCIQDQFRKVLEYTSRLTSLNSSPLLSYSVLEQGMMNLCHKETATFIVSHDQTNFPNFLSQFLDCCVISYEDAFEKSCNHGRRFSTHHTYIVAPQIQYGSPFQRVSEMARKETTSTHDAPNRNCSYRTVS